MRFIIDLSLKLLTLVYITFLASCNQNQRTLNRIGSSELNLALDSTIAFISERNSTEISRAVDITCSGFFIEDRLILSALHCFQSTRVFVLPTGEMVQIPTVLDPTGIEFQFVYRNQIDQSSLILLREEINIASVVAVDLDMDLAILSLTEDTNSSNAYLSISDFEPQIIDTVYTIGHPVELAWSISDGIISRILLDRNVMQTNITIVGGYSGGPLLNIRGEVIGVADSYIRNVSQVSFFVGRQRIQNFLRTYRSHDSR